MSWLLYRLAILLMASTCCVLPVRSAFAAHALAMNGEPKYSADFTHFAYANPQAPKGGHVRRAAIGTFDTFNPYVPKGMAPQGIGLIYDTLCVQSMDEPFTAYGLLAQDITVPPDRSWVRFTLRENARFHDGHPVHAEDVAFTFELLMAKGSPTYANYYGDVSEVEVLGPRQIRFTFEHANNRELPLILGQLPVLPKHFWKGKDFTSAGLTRPLGSGPYTIETFKPGHFVRYKRVASYWGAELAVNTGRYNFDSLQYDYFRDTTVALEAFKAGEYDFRQENTAKHWATAYTGPAVDQGHIVKERIPHDRPQGMQAFIYNTRRPLFSDPEVRRALAYAFDFEWTNSQLFYGQYTRTKSYFSNSELAAQGPPAPEELALLEPHRRHLPEEALTSAYTVPSTETTPLRQNLRQGLRLLRRAGWTMQDGQLVHKQTGKSFQFTILLRSPSFERVVLPFKRNLAKLGITMEIRRVDASQYVNRLRSFDFDMLIATLPQSNSPGNEQRYFWTSEAGSTPGTYNYMGVDNPAIDALVEQVVTAPDRESLITRCRALDRALLWGHYVIPQWHLGALRIARWDIFGRPEKMPRYGLDFFTWWVDPDKAAAVRAFQGR